MPMKSPVNALQIKMASAPKSCLAKHDHSSGSNSEDNDETDCSNVVPQAQPAKAKRVVFADDKGLELTQVKIMSEPSNVPPYWTLQFLAEVTHGLISPVAITEQWVVDFRQPASDYLEFRWVKYAYLICSILLTEGSLSTAFQAHTGGEERLFGKCDCARERVDCRGHSESEKQELRQGGDCACNIRSLEISRGHPMHIL